MLNPSKRSHRETFIKELEKQLENHNIENELQNMCLSTTCQQIEQIDILTTMMLDEATNRVEGVKRNTPFSFKKERKEPKHYF